MNNSSQRKEKKIGRGGREYVPNDAGDGVAFESTKIKPEIMRRIEALGKMNDRREAYKAAGDWMSLVQLADEYEAKKMLKMAESVRLEAYEFRKAAEGGSRKAEGRRRTVADADAVSFYRGAVGAVGGVAAGDT